MGKRSQVHFLTAYLEYLLDEGVRSEERYLGDASRFLRFLLERSGPHDVATFLETTSDSPEYRRRLARSIRRFFEFAREQLGVEMDPAHTLHSN